MKLQKRDELMLDLTLHDLGDDLSGKAAELETAVGASRDEIERELRYLQAVSSRKVVLPSDAYFAGIRQKVYARVTIQPVSIWDRIKAALLEKVLRPMPALVTSAVLLVAVLATMMYYSPAKRIVTEVPYGPYVSMSESYTDSIAKMERGQLTEQELREYREILVMSTAILGSPSSLSRSQALVGAGR